MKWLAPQDRICPSASRRDVAGDVEAGGGIDWLSHSSIRARGA